MHNNTILKAITFVPLLSAPLISLASDIREIPSLTLATEYQSGLSLADYWVSEKYDGIRALWTGTELVTRSGKVLHAPKWFTAPLPRHQMMEGELWAGRDGFNHVQKTVLDNQPDDNAWKNISWMVFDMPLEHGDYRTRYAALSLLSSSLQHSNIEIVPYKKISQESDLMRYLHSLEQKKGEGLILRRIHDNYQAGRSAGLVKLKIHQDAEATVVGYKPGKGRLKGKVGALEVRTENGTEFSLGSGLSDEERTTPPAIGSQVTYRYNGITSKGKPRFARFLRERPNGY